jgi:hypothetical protein
LRGAVMSFQVESALLMAVKGSRLMNLPWPSRVLIVVFLDGNDAAVSV